MPLCNYLTEETSPQSRKRNYRQLLTFSDHLSAACALLGININECYRLWSGVEASVRSRATFLFLETPGF